MVGLLNPPQEQGMPPAGAGQEPRAAQGQEPNVTPEEQAAFEEFVNKGFEVIYDQKTLPGVLGALAGDGDPKEGLANVAAMVVMHLEDSAEGQGRQLDPDIVFHGGIELLNDLANLATEAGIHDFSEDEIEGAMYRALDLYRTMREGQGRLNNEAIQQDFAQLVQADQQGRLGEMMPGLEEHFRDVDPDAAMGGQPDPRERAV